MGAFRPQGPGTRRSIARSLGGETKPDKIRKQGRRLAEHGAERVRFRLDDQAALGGRESVVCTPPRRIRPAPSRTAAGSAPGTRGSKASFRVGIALRRQVCRALIGADQAETILVSRRRARCRTSSADRRARIKGSPARSPSRLLDLGCRGCLPVSGILLLPTQLKISARSQPEVVLAGHAPERRAARQNLIARPDRGLTAAA
jgi:hypothetical protein